MSKRQIRAAFESRLSAWSAGRDTTLRIAWENAPFTPVTGETYLRAFLLPAPTNSIDIAGKHRGFVGIFQVSIIGVSGRGSKATEEIAEELDKLFPLRLCIPARPRPVCVATPMSQGPGLPDGGTFTLPVWWRYRMDAFVSARA
ncbi:DUF4128 domain-containing protein [Alcaligenaceae bacterium]|nr:DUF4128 domain-containing protein [Alcaligenaceae bacterium]